VTAMKKPLWIILRLPIYRDATNSPPKTTGCVI
jgi:hypothetical protein